MPLVENGQIVPDRYRYVGEDEPIPERVPVIVPAQRFLANTDALIRRDGSLGVLWPNDRRIAELAPWLGHLALVALQFPKFRDGRAYSQARSFCARPTAFAARCAPPATCCAISSTSSSAPVSILSR